MFVKTFGERRPIAMPDKKLTYAAPREGDLPTQLYRHRIGNCLAVIGSVFHVGRVRDVYTSTLGSAEDSLRRQRPVASQDEVEARNPNHVRDRTEVVEELAQLTMRVL